MDKETLAGLITGTIIIGIALPWAYVYAPQVFLAIIIAALFVLACFLLVLLIILLYIVVRHTLEKLFPRRYG
jgi:hypothetical protein